MTLRKAHSASSPPLAQSGVTSSNGGEGGWDYHI
jgi:hypothetical protein